VVSASTVTLTQPPTGGLYMGSFTLTAENGPVTYSIAVPAAEAGYLTLAPSAGTLAAGQIATITATVTPNPNVGMTYQNPVTIDPGAITVTILYPPAG